MSKKILGIIIFVILIIIIIIVLILSRIKNNSIELNGLDNIDIGEIVNDITIENSRNDYYLVKNIIENYYLNLSLFNIDNDEMRYFELGRYSTQEELEAERLIYKNKVYNYLSEEYIQANNVNIDNIQSKLGTFYETLVFTEDMYHMDVTSTINAHFVNGYVIEKGTLEKKEFSMRVITDVEKGTFEIYPDGYGYSGEDNKIIKIEEHDIKNKLDNRYNFRAINDELHIKELFKRNIYRFKYDTQGAYERLDGDYKQKRFESFEDFQKYTKDNYDLTKNIQISSYQVTNEKGYTQYVCIDKFGKYYIFRETDIMQYELILDTYTIDIPEFVTKYENVTTQEKVILNINKFRQAINDKNYKYAYSILADSFKANNFVTQDTFENYVKSNFFENNEFEYVEFGNEANTYYTYKVNIKDKSGNNITKTFIVLLEDGTNFKLSFNV